MPHLSPKLCNSATKSKLSIMCWHWSILSINFFTCTHKNREQQTFLCVEASQIQTNVQKANALCSKRCLALATVEVFPEEQNLRKPKIEQLNIPHSKQPNATFKSTIQASLLPTDSGEAADTKLESASGERAGRCCMASGRKSSKKMRDRSATSSTQGGIRRLVSTR